MWPDKQRLSLGACVLPIVCCLITYPLSASSQTDQELSRLVFDPVLLSGGNETRGHKSSFIHTGTSPEYSSASSGNSTRTAASPLSLSSDSSDAPPPATFLSAPIETIDEYQTTIEDTVEQEGAYAPDQQEALLSLARLFQQQGLHTQAIEAFAEAEHISRVNNGLYHSAHVPIIEGMIDSYLALQDYRNALDRQEHLLHLHKNYSDEDSEDFLASLMALGNRHMDIYSQLMLTPDNAMVNLGDGQMGGISESQRDFAINDLFNAKNLYFEAITTMVNKEMFSNPILWETENKFLETIFLAGYNVEQQLAPQYYMGRARKSSQNASRWGFLRRNKTGYETGLQALERMQHYLEQTSDATPEEKVEARMALGDWHLLYGRRDAAVQQYRRAYAFAEKEEMPSGNIKKLFNAELPIQLPLITPKPNTREILNIPENEKLNYDGYIDMAFTINHNGTAKNFEILDMSENTTLKIQQQLREHLRNGPFRPIIQDVKVARNAQRIIRYHYAFTDLD